MIDPVRFTQDLVAIPSVSGSGRITPELQAVMDLTESTASAAGISLLRQKFTVESEHYPEGRHEGEWMVLWRGALRGSVAAIGHTDVVNPHDQSDWKHDNKFNPEIVSIGGKEFIIACGALDMKAAVASYISAMADGMALILVNDEEHLAMGIVKAIEYLRNNDLLPEAFIGIEPTSHLAFGDEIKRARRGDLVLHARYTGENGLHDLVRHLSPFAHQPEWDHGRSDGTFPASRSEIISFTDSQLNTNVIPAQAHAVFSVPLEADHRVEHRVSSFRHFMKRCLQEYDKQHPHSVRPEGDILTLHSAISNGTGRLQVVCSIKGVPAHSAFHTRFYNPNARMIHILNRIIDNGTDIRITGLSNTEYCGNPQGAGLTLDTRLNSLHKPGAIKDEILKLLQPEKPDQFAVQCSFDRPAYLADMNNPAVSACREALAAEGITTKFNNTGGYADTCMAQVLTGSQNIVELGFPREAAAAHFRDHSIPGGGMHAPNEAVAVSDIFLARKMYGEVARRYAESRLAMVR